MTHGLVAELERLDVILAPHIEYFRETRDRTADAFGGAYIPDGEIAAIRAGTQPPAGPLPPPPTEGPLAGLMRLFRLTQLERDILLVAAAPEFEPRYQTLYAWLQNDATRRHPTAGFALGLLCHDAEERWNSLRCFDGNRDLLSNRLIRVVEDPHDRDPVLAAVQFRLVPRIAAVLGGDTASDPAMARFARVITPKTRMQDLELPTVALAKLESIGAAISGGGILQLRGQTDGGQLKVAEALCRQLGRKLLICEGDLCDADSSAVLRREARLLNAGLFVTGATSLMARDLANAPFPIIAADVGREAVSPATEGVVSVREVKWTHLRAFRLDLEVPDVASRLTLWKRTLNGSGERPDVVAALPALAGKFCFDPSQIEETVARARSLALLGKGREVGIAADDLNDAARSQSVAGLRQLARLVTTDYAWDDLVVPPRVARQLREILDSVRLRHTVHAEWQFQRKAGGNPGLTVMFSGLSGTGKTMAASILANELQLDLYKIDLSCIVSKYIGETEKNLGRIFDAARSSSAILFFDEADAIFGKRSEVKDAHDRYANIEVAFLLQKMEDFPGLAILATNFARNLDTAFQRRLHHVIEFPFPDASQREIIWRRMFPDAAPRSADIDFPFLGRQFDLAGGNIRNVVIAAAYLAAAAGERISMEHLIRSTGREVQKTGKMPARAEFGGYFETLREQM
jgi:hypothetical protein